MNLKKHIYLSYVNSESTKDSIPDCLRKELCQQRLRVYQPQLNEDINTVIANGIEQAAIVLIFPSLSLQNSKNGSKIVNYADQRKTPMLTIKHLRDFQPTAWLGAILAPMKSCSPEYTEIRTAMESLTKLDEITLDMNEVNDGPSEERQELFHGEHSKGNITAHYVQYGEKYSMTFQFLGLRDGRIYGQGDDEVGSFTMAGEYDDIIKSKKGKFSFVKRYVGAHSVMYAGTISEKGKKIILEGQWELEGFKDDCVLELTLDDDIRDIRRRHGKDKSRSNEEANAADTFKSNHLRDFATTVMISYCAGQEELANKIADGLNNNGIKAICPPLDATAMIKEAAKNAKVVVPLMSSAYQASEIAKSVLSYVDEAGIPIAPVKAEDPYTQSGWLGVICAGALWTQMTKDSEFPQRLHDLMGQLAPHFAKYNTSDDKGADVLVDGSSAIGYFIQKGAKHEMKFDMFAMANGEIAGQGDDHKGSFKLHGKYRRGGSDKLKEKILNPFKRVLHIDTPHKQKFKVKFIKRYIGQHEVYYKGKAALSDSFVILDGKWTAEGVTDTFHLEAVHTRQSGPSGHVMLSYQWNNQELVKRIADMLKQRNIPIWFDIDGGMKGNINASMADGVEKAAIILSFDTAAYAKSINCQKELTYASQLKKVIIPVLLDDTKALDGTWLEMIIASLNKINMQDTNQFDASFSNLTMQIDSILNLQKREAKKRHPSKTPPTRFRGGPVYGEYYQYDEPHPMSFEYFTLHDGMVSGQGQDEVGPFTMAGHYDIEGNVDFVKQYVGQHAVEYLGTLECKCDGDFVITGKWAIPSAGLSDKFSLRNKL